MFVASFAWVRSVQKTIVCLLLGASLAALPGCGGGGTAPVITTKPCTLNSDCNTGLVCSFGLCHSECKVSADCPAGERCISGAMTSPGDAGPSMATNVCQLPAENKCEFNSDCQDPLVCAVDRQCRDQCKMDRDCVTGQVCANGGVCADPTEVTATGNLKDAVDAGVTDSGGNGEAGASGTDSGSDSGTDGGPDAGPACVDGASCVPSAAPCDTGTISCASGSAVCVDSGTAASDGTGCGTNKVCSVGACVACKVNDVCQPDPNNACATGKLSCAAGPVCTANGNTADGTACGTGKVCSVGACVACVDGTVCTPADACKAGAMACETGPTCVSGANLTAGTACDTGKVCDSSANCTACVQGGSCTPTGNDCHAGTYDCTTGPNCVDQGTNAQDGVACGTVANSFCSTGTCAACVNSNPCIPTNACHKGTLNCATTPATCNDSQTAVTDGLSCGTNESCIQGVCHTNDRTLTITAGGGGSVVVDSTFPTVTVHLVDSTNAVVAGAAVTVTATSGGYGVASATTNGSGNANVTGRVGRLAGQVYTYTVSAPGATPITFTETATAATAGNIFTIENVTHAAGGTNGPVTPLPGTTAQTYYQIYAATVGKNTTAGSDGTVYFADYCNVYQLSTLGEVTRVAGAGGYYGCGTALGDGGLGTAAELYGVQALALDEVNKVLYIADISNSRVRQLDLTSGTITTYAGGGTNAVPYGDNGPASGAYVYPYGLSLAPNGDLYISDTGNRIRKVDVNTGVITTYRAAGSCSSALPITLEQCGGYGDSCNLAWDSAGHAFIAGYFCGGSLPGGMIGVARVEADNSLTIVAGAYSGSKSDGIPATGAQFESTPAIAFDAAGNLYGTVRSANRIRRIDAVTTKITTIAGDPLGGAVTPATPASVTDYVAGTAVANLYNPTGISFDSAGSLYFADFSNYAVRSVATIGNSTAGTAKLATQGGTGNTVTIDAPFPVLQVKLTDGSNAPIGGVPVQWTRVDPGSGFVGASATHFDSVVSLTLGSGLTNGVSGESGRVGLAAPGPYHFTASFTDLHGVQVTGSPQTLSVATQAPAAGTIFPVVNYVHASGHQPLPAPATFSELDNATGLAIASTGTMYVADNYAVYQVTPQGEMSVLAGTPGQNGYVGDGGLANGAKFYNIRGLALDEPNQLLYVADYSNYAIRQIDLTTGNINAFAGSPSLTSQTAPWGDGGQAINAYVGAPMSVSVDSAGLVYIVDTYHSKIRVVDPTTNVITTWLTVNSTAICTGSVVPYSLSQFSEVLFDSLGGAYISGNLCGSETGNTTALGILYRSKTGTYTRILGSNVANTNENISPLSASLPDLGGMALDSAGDIAVSIYSGQKVRVISKATGKINTVAGNGTAGYFTAGDVTNPPGDYEAATGVELYYPMRLAYAPGNHLVIGDYDNYAFREIW